MRAASLLQRSGREPVARLARRAVSMLTIAAGLFVLGFFLMVNANIQRDRRPLEPTPRSWPSTSATTRSPSRSPWSTSC